MSTEREQYDQSTKAGIEAALKQFGPVMESHFTDGTWRDVQFADALGRKWAFYRKVGTNEISYARPCGLERIVPVVAVTKQSSGSYTAHSVTFRTVLDLK